MLITGGLGMVGSTAAIRLVELGAEVTLLDPQLEWMGGNPFNIAPVRDRLRWLPLDIRAPQQRLLDAIGAPAYVINCAGQVDHRRSEGDKREADLDINVNGQRNLLAALAAAGRAAGRAPAVAFCSSRMVYGDAPAGEISEDSPAAPQTHYARNKLRAEALHAEAAARGELAAVTLRISNAYGPRSHMRHEISYSVACKFIRRALDGEPITLFEGLARNTTDYVYVGDLVEALLLAALSAAERGGARVLNLGSGTQTPLEQLAREIVRLAGRGEITSVPCPPAYRTFANQASMRYRSERAREQLGWAPRTDLAAGLSETIAYYQQHGHHYWSAPE